MYCMKRVEEMKLLSSGSYNIAWFKLADFVSRGEKERALNVYKLLMHSIQDEAFAYQLEGDILLSFQDYKAIDRYKVAANLYKKNGNYQKAIAVCEQSLSLKEDMSQFEDLLYMYELIGDQVKILHTYFRYAALAVQTNNIEQLIDRLAMYKASYQDVFIAELYGYTFLAFLMHNPTHLTIEEYLFMTLKLYIEHEKDCQLTRFMAKLKVSSELFYQKAQIFLCEK